MAEGQSMTLEQVVRDVMAGEQADVLRESVRLVVQELMNAEVSELIGAQRRHPRAGNPLARRSRIRREEHS
jgi:transposase-like protein